MDSKDLPEKPKNQESKESLKNRLSPLAWKVTQEKATEAPYSGKFNDFNEGGDYFCICCDRHLFCSDHKFDSQCGWPAFHKALESSTVEIMDYSHGMTRIEILCSDCNAHLGHKFPDGPFGTRYCINSVCLRFEPS